ncbi:MAG TPA: hypothetical protein VJA21_24505 [Verrucomicrobiae bacterium]
MLRVRQQDIPVDSGSRREAGGAFELGFTPGRFAALLAVLIFVAFPQVLLGLQTFVVRDFGFFAYPLAHYLRECFWKGEVPLWNPFSHCGVPFLAQWNTMPLYPPALIYLLLPLSWSLSFFCLAHLFWAGLGMYFLARRWTGSRLGAALAGLIFGFNGFSLNLLMWPSHIATLSWMPWVVLTAEAGWVSGGRKIAAAALVGALQMLAGGPETIFFTWAICGVLWVAHLVAECQASGVRAMLKPFARFPAIVLLVAGLAAAQLLPFLDLAAHSQREGGFADTRWSMPARGWANFLVPMAFGTTVKQGLFFQHGQYWTSSYYLGISTLVLAALGVARVFTSHGMRRNRSTEMSSAYAARAAQADNMSALQLGETSGPGRGRRVRLWLLTGGALLALVLATGDQTILSRFARRLLPQLALMTYPVKFVTVAVFALPMLAAFGMAWLEKPVKSPPRNRLLASGAIVAVLLIFVLFWVWLSPLANDNTGAALRNGLGRAAFLIVTVALLTALVPGKLTKAPESLVTRPLLVTLLLVVFWLDIWTHEPQQNPVVPSWVYQPGLARLQLALNPEPGLGRSRVMVSPAAQRDYLRTVLEDVKANYLVKRLGFFADCNLLDSVPKVDGFFSLCPRECGELNSAVYVSGVGYGAGLPDFLSVSHITVPGESGKWTTRDTFLPLATGGQVPLFLDDTNALRTLLSADFDPRKNVILPFEARALASTVGRSPVRVLVKSIQTTAHQVDFEVDAANPAVVVLAQTYYHPWRAWVDESPATLLRANYAFQALVVPAGAHQVRLRYVDRMFQVGMGVSAAALAVCLGWVLGPALVQRFADQGQQDK